MNPYNYPNSYGYDPNLPIGYIHWEDYPDEEQDEPDEDIPLENYTD